CMRISAPASVRRVTACRDPGSAMIAPLQGACRVAFVGSTARPSPSIRPAKTGSGASSRGVLQPASGATRTSVRSVSVAGILRRAFGIEMRSQGIQQAVSRIVLTQHPDHSPAQVLTAREIRLDRERPGIVIGEKDMLTRVIEPRRLGTGAPVTHPVGAREKMPGDGLPGRLREAILVLRVEASVLRRYPGEAA